MSCVVRITVHLPDGKPASFAKVAAFEVVKVLWWEIDRWVVSTTANFNGIASFTLARGKKYHFIFKSGSRKGDVWRTLDTCPYYFGATFS